ncbi:MAG: 50S ribosomal protein L1, partial [Patescibacteria group bacterium]
TTRFDATVEAHFAINKELLTKEKYTLSGRTILPHGTGKKKIVKIADDDLIAKIASGVIDFDILVSPPELMPKLAKVARILGPKGLMPNPKNGTVSPDPQKRAKELEGGEINWKTEPDQPLIHHAVGKVSFTPKKLSENILSLVKSIDKNKLVKLTLSSSMGPGIKVDLSTL